MSDYKMTLKEQIAAFTASQIESIFKLTDGNNAEILTGGQVTNYLTYKYGDYYTLTPVQGLWVLYNATHRADFIKAYNAWTTAYNPLDNYNANETNVYLTSDGAETSTTWHGKTVTTSLTDVQTDNMITTDESQTPRLDTRTTNSGSTTDAESGTTTTCVDHTAKSLSIDGTTYSADNVHGELKKKTGNIGVTTSQQMLSAEIDLRMNPLIELYIDEFVSDYTYYFYKGGFGYDS